MAGYYDNVDLRWDDNGDYTIDKTGDIEDTSYDTIVSTETEIKDILKSSVNDWLLYPYKAAQVKEFIGQQNTREVGQAIAARLRSALVLNKIAAIDDIYIKVIPVRYDTILIVLVLQAYATPTNRLESGEPLTLSFFMDLSDGFLAFNEQQKNINLFPVGEK